MPDSQYSFAYLSPLGPMTLASDGENITGLWFNDQKYFAAPPNAVHGGPKVFSLAAQWLDSYFAGERPAPSLPLRPAGGAFRQSVWDILVRVPYGQVITYGGIARDMAAQMGRDTMSAQAVGGAVGHNPISILIPCHRVVGTNGSLTGYAGGLERKIALLKLEGADMAALFRPKKGAAL